MPNPTPSHTTPPPRDAFIAPVSLAGLSYPRFQNNQRSGMGVKRFSQLTVVKPPALSFGSFLIHTHERGRKRIKRRKTRASGRCRFPTRAAFGPRGNRSTAEPSPRAQASLGHPHSARCRNVNDADISCKSMRSHRLRRARGKEEN